MVFNFDSLSPWSFWACAFDYLTFSLGVNQLGREEETERTC